MKKLNFKKLALLGLASGLVMGAAGCESNANADTEQTAEQKTPMTEADLMKQLNSEGKKTYQSLDPEGKALALKLANQSCKGQNDCKGLNSCKSKDNSCAGLGGCKGTSPGPFTDKNDAVKVAAMKMKEKRAQLNK